MDYYTPWEQIYLVMNNMRHNNQQGNVNCDMFSHIIDYIRNRQRDDVIDMIVDNYSNDLSQ